MLYFAYGSNLNLDQMKGRCPGSSKVGPAYLEGWSLAFRGPLDIVKQEGSVVPGFIFDINESDLRALDRYEGYPYLYNRVTVPINTRDSNMLAITYTMNRKKHVAMPGRSYWETVLTGYYQCGLANHLNILKRAFRQAQVSRI